MFESDLGYGSFSPESIFSGLQKTWSLALSSSPTTKVLALTVPESAYVSTKLKRNRDALNKSILEHQEDRLYVLHFLLIDVYFFSKCELTNQLHV